LLFFSHKFQIHARKKKDRGQPYPTTSVKSRNKFFIEKMGKFQLFWGGLDLAERGLTFFCMLTFESLLSKKLIVRSDFCPIPILLASDSVKHMVRETKDFLNSK
tara:strand:- start:915 stop:1226 length:312 start_codon:yes stop_codon:yes gene_type:complete